MNRSMPSVPLPSRDTKIAVYHAVVLTTLLYGCETWTLYRHSVRKLGQFHLQCLRKIAGIQWQDRIPNTEVLQMCGIPGIEAIILKSQLRWVGHIIRMPDSRISKRIFFHKAGRSEGSKTSSRVT